MYKSISIIIEQMGHLYHFSWGVVPRWPASYGRLSKRHGLRFSRWRFSTYPLVNVYTLCELEHDDLESSLVLTHFSEGVFPSFFVKGFSIEAKPPFSHSFPTVSYDFSIQTSVSQRIRSVPVQSQLLVPPSWSIALIVVHGAFLLAASRCRRTLGKYYYW
jgi:hypothetical protein